MFQYVFSNDMIDTLWFFNTFINCHITLCLLLFPLASSTFPRHSYVFLPYGVFFQFLSFLCVTNSGLLPGLMTLSRGSTYWYNYYLFLRLMNSVEASTLTAAVKLIMPKWKIIGSIFRLGPLWWQKCLDGPVNHFGKLTGSEGSENLKIDRIETKPSQYSHNIFFSILS